MNTTGLQHELALSQFYQYQNAASNYAIKAQCHPNTTSTKRQWI